MSWEDAAADDVEVEVEEQGDSSSASPLASLDDETRAQVEAWAEQQAAQRAQEAAEAAQRETETRFRAGNGRWGQAAKELAGWGVVVDEHGRPAVQDPQRFQQAAQQFSGGQQPPAAATPDPEPGPPDYILDPQGFIRWMDQRSERRAEALAEKLIAPLRQENQQLRAAALSSTAETALTLATPFLTRTGGAHLVESDEFRQQFQYALGQVTQDPRQWSDPKIVRLAAGAALSQLPDEAWEVEQQEQPAARPRNPALTARGGQQALNRGGLAQIGTSSRGGAPEQDTYSRELVEAAKAADMTPQEFLTWMPGENPNAPRKSYHDYADRTIAAARRSRR